MKQPHYNAETEAAMQEARDIMSGKIKAKSYASADELFAKLKKIRNNQSMKNYGGKHG
jgi:DNA-damage-inducible protein J